MRLNYKHDLQINKLIDIYIYTLSIYKKSMISKHLIKQEKSMHTKKRIDAYRRLTFTL